MKIQPENETVDRSRLKLLGALAAASASGGCGATGSSGSSSKTKKKPSGYLVTPSEPNSLGPDDPLVNLKKTFSSRKQKIVPVYSDEPAGGESGGGGSH